MINIDLFLALFIHFSIFLSHRSRTPSINSDCRLGSKNFPILSVILWLKICILSFWPFVTQETNRNCIFYHCDDYNVWYNQIAKNRTCFTKTDIYATPIKVFMKTLSFKKSYFLRSNSRWKVKNRNKYEKVKFAHKRYD